MVAGGATVTSSSIPPFTRPHVLPIFVPCYRTLWPSSPQQASIKCAVEEQTSTAACPYPLLQFGQVVAVSFIPLGGQATMGRRPTKLATRRCSTAPPCSTSTAKRSASTPSSSYPSPISSSPDETQDRQKISPWSPEEQ
ncbi:hypothetical protein EJB05_28229, partial [Eragrostis curvula]